MRARCARSWATTRVVPDSSPNPVSGTGWSTRTSRNEPRQWSALVAFGDQDWHRRHDGVRAVEQSSLEREGRLVVQPLGLPLRDEFGDDHGDDVVDGVGVELVEILE